MGNTEGVRILGLLCWFWVFLIAGKQTTTAKRPGTERGTVKIKQPRYFRSDLTFKWMCYFCPNCLVTNKHTEAYINNKSSAGSSGLLSTISYIQMSPLWLIYILSCGFPGCWLSSPLPTPLFFILIVPSNCILFSNGPNTFFINQWEQYKFRVYKRIIS